jgi:subtilisin family serine protease
MEKEYAVIVKRGIDIAEVDADLAASTGSGPIPSRSVDVANPRLGSKRITHWMLTDEEAQELQSDPRIQAVEIPPDQRDDLIIKLKSTQTADFTKPSAIDANLVNWGLRRVIEETNVYGQTLTAPDNNYPYALDGAGVDIVIQDSGIQHDHPEFNDYNGSTRVQDIDWYTASGLVGTQNVNHNRDYDGHGTHSAGIAAGLTYGWAKGAHIYSQKLSGLEGVGDTGTGIPVADAFDSIRLWHAAKTNGRPTVVNMSWGYFSQPTDDPTGGIYRGTPWTFTTQSEADLWRDYGIVSSYGGLYRIIPARNAFADAEIEDMIDAGIVVVVAAGNDYYKQDLSSGPDYDNVVYIDGLTYTYHRGSSPYSDDALKVGALATDTFNDNGNYLDRVANFSNRGPAVDIWAPGVNIISCTSNTNVYTGINYPNDANFKIAMLQGTSEAAPQVAGVAALMLSSRPDLTPAQIKQKLLNEAKNVVYDTGLDNDYPQFSTTLLGSANKILYSKYGRQPHSITGSVTIS